MILRADVARQVADHDLARQRNFELAGLVAFSFHEPKKIPTFSGAGQSTSDKSTSGKSEEDANAEFRAYMIAKASLSKPQSS